jgi:hypothetical protein
MPGSPRSGGYAALVAAATYVVGFVLLLTLIEPAVTGSAGTDPADADRAVAFIAEHQGLIYAWNLAIYVVNGVALVALVLALQRRLSGHASATAGAATAFGLIWAGLVLASGMLILNDLGVVADIHATDPVRAASVWQALHAVEEGLGGGVELPGGLWVLLVSFASLRGGSLPRLLAYLGVLTGTAGVLTVLPAADTFEAVFGLGMLAWFTWLGIVLQREHGRRSGAIARERPSEPLDDRRRQAETRR